MVRLPSLHIPERKAAIGLFMLSSMEPRSGVTSLEEHCCIMHGLGGSCTTLIWLLQTPPGPHASLSASWGVSEASLGQVKYIIPSAGSCSPVSSEENQESVGSPDPTTGPLRHNVIKSSLQRCSSCIVSRVTHREKVKRVAQFSLPHEAPQIQWQLQTRSVNLSERQQKRSIKK